MGSEKLKEVILLTSDEKARSYKWEDNANALRGIQVISKENDLDKFKHITFLGFKDDLEQVFVKDPFYPKVYVEINKAEKRIFDNKIKFYKKIALLLGAKSFNADAEFIDESKATIDANGKISYKLVQVDASLSKQESSRFKKKYALKSVLTPIENFDRYRGFEDAKALIKLHNLENETSIVGLIENNDPYLQSRETKQTVKLELTSELNDLLEMSFNINALGGVFALGANFKKTTETMKTIILQTEIEF
jgi:hypothetical protein